jgi:hypothetical protein
MQQANAALSLSKTPLPAAATPIFSQLLRPRSAFLSQLSFVRCSILYTLVGHPTDSTPHLSHHPTQTLISALRVRNDPYR